LLREAGIAMAVLLYMAGNIRAERFYMRAGWNLSHSFEDALWNPEGMREKFIVLTYRFEKNPKLVP
jgi:hypothetical protein